MNHFQEKTLAKREQFQRMAGKFAAQQPKLTLTINAPVATVEAFKALAKSEGLGHAALLAKLLDNHTRQSQ